VRSTPPPAHSHGAFVVLAVLSLLLGACGGGGGGGAGTMTVGSLLDETGPLNSYGLPMQAAAKLAIDDINHSGGVLGKQLKLVDDDSQSDIARYTVLARQLATSDVAVVQGGITSASREAIRPIFHSARKLYFYNPLYEGGVCDKNTFVTGVTPTQQLEPLLKWTVDQGKKKWYVLAANYNYGTISASWVQKLAAQYGARIVGGPSFFDLTVTDFTSQLPKIQASGADTIVSLLVGAGHLNFYKQWTASGMNRTTTIVSPTFGFGSEQVALGPSGAGILSAFPYFQELDTPASAKFNELWKTTGVSGAITPGAESTWVGWHLWAEAVNKAGTTDRDKVIAALETGLSYDGPAGTYKMDPGSHHTIVPMRLWKDDGKGGFQLVTVLSPAAAPTFEQSKCDLIKNPDLNQQFTP
jgi:urea transport system substrate-binding protein